MASIKNLTGSKDSELESINGTVNENLMDDNPFRSFKIKEERQLFTEEKKLCLQCNKLRKVYCPIDFIPINHIPPKVTLPIELIIYRHPQELSSKTTTTHIKILAPQQTKIILHNFYLHGLPSNLNDNQKESGEEVISNVEFIDVDRTLLLYPTENSKDLSEIDRNSFDKLIVIDGTWNQSKTMAKVLSSKGFRQVRIKTEKTLFWRYQSLSENYLATVEAVYYFFKDFDTTYNKKVNEDYIYDGKFDNLLFYFKMQYDLIQNEYKSNP
ncbi:DTW domain-containing protein 1, partial [Lobulomyces angularis]